MSRNPDVVVAGHICLDIIPGLGAMDPAGPEDFFTPGLLIETGGAELSTGGAVSNTGLGLLKLGNDTALMGKVGRDPFGRLVLMLLEERWGVTEGMIVDGGAATSYSVVLAPGRYDRMFLHFPGANDTFCGADVDYDLAGGARLFHFGYPPVMRRLYADSGRELAGVFRRVKESGATTSLDLSLPDPASPAGKVDWRAFLANILPHVDLCLPSAEEALFMLDRARFDEYRARSGGDMAALFTGDDLHALGGGLLDMGARVVLIKCGHRGAYLRTGGMSALEEMGRGAPAEAARWAERELWHPCFRIDVTPSTTGSGDATNAGFLTALLRGLPAREALRCAAAAGAFSVSAPDALSGLKTWDDLTAALEAGWKTAPLRVEGKGWRETGQFRSGPADGRT